MERYAAILVCLLTPGCILVQVGAKNPIPGLSTVAVAPFFNLSQEKAVDGRRFALAYFAELQKTPGFEVVPVGVTEQAIHDNDLEMNDPEDVLVLARILGVDAVAVGAVTDYDPYYPPRIGLKIAWYSPQQWAFSPGFPASSQHGQGSSSSGGGPEESGGGAEKNAHRCSYAGTCSSGGSCIRGQSQEEWATGDLAEGESQGQWQPVGPLESEAFDWDRHAERPRTANDAAEEACDRDEFWAEASFWEDQGQAKMHPLEAKDSTGNPPGAGEMPSVGLETPPSGSPPPHGPADAMMAAGSAEADRSQTYTLLPDAQFDPRQPLMSYARVFDGSDANLVARLRDYVELSGDRRSGGWEAYLHRSEDFIRFTAHVIIVEMLTLHGGEGPRRFVLKRRKFE